MNFVTNRWVRGPEFIGRKEILNQLQNRLDRPTWVLGNRRVGKTSLLRHIEWLCKTERWPGVHTLYWDFQGAGSSDGLKESLLESLDDAPDLMETLGIEVDAWEEMSFQELTMRLRRRLRTSGVDRLILLIDEVEELVDICVQEPGVLASLRKLHGREARVNMMVTGSLRLLDLDESASRTSPFLPDFLPPLLLGPFQEQDSLRLLQRAGISEDDGRMIHNHTLGNPHLVQTVGQRFLAKPDLAAVTEELARTKVLDYYFQSCFNCLTPDMRAWYLNREACFRLGKLERNDECSAYAEQSSLLTFTSSGKPRVSPLLRFLEGDVENQVTDKGHGTRQAQGSWEPIFTRLADTNTPISVLPATWLEPEANGLDEDPNPVAGFHVMFSAGANHRELLDVLNRAAPEYIHSAPPDERTHVYLAGLLLFHKTYGQGPFSEIDDPFERAEQLSSTAPVIPTRDSSGQPVDPRLAMILLRALNPRPSDRYPDLESLKDDLETSNA